MRKTELDKYIESIKAIKPNFRLRIGKRVIFVDILENGKTSDGVNNYKVNLLDGEIIQIFKGTAQNFLSKNNGYMVQLLDGSKKRIGRNDIIEII